MISSGPAMLTGTPDKRKRWFENRPLVALAPMEAITDSVYRTIVRLVAPEVILYTEFVPCAGLLHGGDRVRKMAEFPEEQRPLIVQLYDHDLDAIELAAGTIAREFKPDGLDLNMGCPVRKVFRRGAGVGMMADPEHAAQAVRRMVDVADGIPVSAKMRLGVHHKDEVLEVARMIVDAGAEQVTIHGRLKSDRPGVSADWEAISRAAQTIDAVVIGNGDIWTVEDAAKMAALDGIDGVMIGRGAIGNPWLLQRCRQQLAGEKVDTPPHRAERARIALKHLEMNVAAKGERRGVRELRKMVRNYIKGYHDSRRIWLKIIEAETLVETARILEEFGSGNGEISLVDGPAELD